MSTSPPRLRELADEQQLYADAHRREIVARCKTLGMPVASHDDTLVEHVEQAAAEGIVLAEFPTTRIAAEAAREHGISTIMGAPNIVRGGSHSGNVSALELAQGRSAGYPLVGLRAVEPADCRVRTG